MAAIRPRRLWEAWQAKRDGTIERNLQFYPLELRALKALLGLLERNPPAASDAMPR